MTDLPRLAEGTAAEDFAGVPKLLDVRIENGWVHATLPNAADSKHWWSPWKDYYSNPDEPPFLRLLQCKSSDREVVDFLQSCGSIVEDRLGAKGRIAFRIALFHFEKWQFSFLAGLLREYQRPENLRRVFLEQLDDAEESLQKFKGPMEGGPWGQEVRGLWHTINRNDPPQPVPLNALKSKLTKMEPANVQKAARLYIARIITEKVKKLRLAFEIGSSGWRLYAHSDDLLESLYWMLAEYFAGRKQLSRCAACGRVFVGSGKYCATKVECKELGRRRLDWQRNKDRYNRTRRLKRRRKKGK